MNDYSILWQGKVVGKASFCKEGMFYKVLCTCKPPKKDKYEVNIRMGNQEIPVGLCVWSGDVAKAQKRLPVSVIDGQDIQICLENRNEKNLCIAVDPQKPFPVLEKLKTAKVSFDKTNRLCNIIIQKP